MMMSFGIEKFVVDEKMHKDIEKEREQYLKFTSRQATYRYFHPETVTKKVSPAESK